MNFIIAVILSSLYYLWFGLLLALFHPIQVLAHWIFGDKTRRGVVDVLNYLLVHGLRILGCRFKFYGFEKIPANRPLIIVSNHQSLFDIPAIVVGFKKYTAKFISKKELGKGLPSISYNLKHGKSALIDRKNGAQSVKEIFKLGKLIEENNYSACIFPEGTRSKTGKVRKFMSAGINTLVRAAPSAVIIPFVIDGHCQLMEKGAFPLKVGQKISYTVLDPIEPKGKDIEEMVTQIQNSIQQSLSN